MVEKVGTYQVGGIDCEVKVDDHGDYVVVYSTATDSETPIPGSQVKIQK